jgi:hypothetical protein
MTLRDNLRDWNLTLELLQQPMPAPAAKTIQSALQRKKLVIVLGSCTVQYKGRASSTLEVGERLLIVKQDCALLVHRPRGYQPVTSYPFKVSSFGPLSYLFSPLAHVLWLWITHLENILQEGVVNL